MVYSLEAIQSGKHLKPSKLPFNTRISDPPSFKRLFMAISCRLHNENEWALLHLLPCQDYPTGLIPPFIDRLTTLAIYLLKQQSSSHPLFAPNTNHLLLYTMVCLNNLAIANGSALISIPETFELLNSVLDCNTLFKDELMIKKLAFSILISMANSRWIPTGKQVWLYKKACFYLVNDDRYFTSSAAQMLSTMIKMNPHQQLPLIYDQIIKYTERLVQLIVPRGYDVDLKNGAFMDHLVSDQLMITNVLELLFYATFHSQVVVEMLYMHPRDVVSILIYYLSTPSSKIEGIPLYCALILNAIFKQYQVVDLEIIYRNIQQQPNQHWWMQWYVSLIRNQPSMPS